MDKMLFNHIDEIIENNLTTKFNHIEKILTEKLEQIESVLTQKIEQTIDSKFEEYKKSSITKEQPHSDSDFLLNHINDEFELNDENYVSPLKSLENLEDKLKIGDIEKFLIDNGFSSFTKRKFLHYIDSGLIPAAIEKNKNQATYSKKHILYYILASQPVELLGIENTKKYMTVIEPLIKTDEVFDSMNQILQISNTMGPLIMDVMRKFAIHGFKNALEEKEEDREFVEEYAEFLDYFMDIVITTLFISIANKVANYGSELDELVKEYGINGEKREILDNLVNKMLSEDEEDDEYEEDEEYKGDEEYRVDEEDLEF